MPRIHWPLQRGRPSVQILLTLAPSRQPLPRTLLADTGAGSQTAGFDLILEEADCLRCSGTLQHGAVVLRGSFVGPFPTYVLPVQIPALGFIRRLRVVAVPSPPPRFDGIACFGFLNRFTYGNFGNPGEFGLES